MSWLKKPGQRYYYALWKEVSGGAQGTKDVEQLHYSNSVPEQNLVVEDAKEMADEFAFQYFVKRQEWLHEMDAAIKSEDLIINSMQQHYLHITVIIADPGTAEKFAQHPDLIRMLEDEQCRFVIINPSRECHDQAHGKLDDIGIPFADRCKSLTADVEKYLETLGLKEKILLLKQDPTTGLFLLFVEGAFNFEDLSAFRFAWQVFELIWREKPGFIP